MQLNAVIIHLYHFNLLCFCFLFLLSRNKSPFQVFGCNSSNAIPKLYYSTPNALAETFPQICKLFFSLQHIRSCHFHELSWLSPSKKLTEKAIIKYFCNGVTMCLSNTQSTGDNIFTGHCIQASVKFHWKNGWWNATNAIVMLDAWNWHRFLLTSIFYLRHRQFNWIAPVITFDSMRLYSNSCWHNRNIFTLNFEMTVALPLFPTLFKVESRFSANKSSLFSSFVLASLRHSIFIK